MSEGFLGQIVLKPKLAKRPQPPSAPYVMAQVGHNHPKVTLGIYAQVISSKDDHGAALDGLVGDIDGSALSVKSEV